MRRCRDDVLRYAAFSFAKMAEQLRSLDLKWSEPLTRGKVAELERSHVFSSTPKNFHQWTKSVDKWATCGWATGATGTAAHADGARSVRD